MKVLPTLVIGLLMVMGAAMATGQTQAIDNSSLGKPEFREHKATYGLVYKLPKDATVT